VSSTVARHTRSAPSSLRSQARPRSCLCLRRAAGISSCESARSTCVGLRPAARTHVDVLVSPADRYPCRGRGRAASTGRGHGRARGGSSVSACDRVRAHEAARVDAVRTLIHRARVPCANCPRSRRRPRDAADAAAIFVRCWATLDLNRLPTDDVRELARAHPEIGPVWAALRRRYRT
jgi:hypothetical protein